MKKILILVAALFIAIISVKAQCPAHVKYTAGKMEMLDSGMNLVDSKDGATVLETTAKGFSAGQEDHEDDSLFGTLKSVTCNWQEPYKNGKITMVCDVHTNHEDLVGVMVTIEAVNGKITIILHAKEYPDRIIRLPIDKYEEVK